MDKVILDRSDKSSIGFSAEVKQKKEINTQDVLSGLESEDLVKYGLIPEFVGRLPVVATLHELDEDALVDILVRPKNALTKQFHTLFKMEGVELEFREEALRLVARKALERKIGARGLRTILENILLDTMYDLPSLEGVSQVVVDESVINKASKPILIYEGEDQQPSAASGGKE